MYGFDDQLYVIEDVVAGGATEEVVMPTCATVMSIKRSATIGFFVVCSRSSYKEHERNDNIREDHLSIQFAISSLTRQFTSAFGQLSSAQAFILWPLVILVCFLFPFPPQY